MVKSTMTKILHYNILNSMEEWDLIVHFHELKINLYCLLKAVVWERKR